MSARGGAGRGGRAVAAVALAAALGAPSSGCYTLGPVGGGPPPAGQTVTVQLNALGRRTLSDALGPDAVQVHGRVVGETRGALVLDVTRVVRRSGEDGAVAGQRVEIPEAFTDRVTQRRFSRARTAALIAGATVAGALLAPRVGLVGGGTGRPGGGGPTGPPKGS